MRAIKLYGTAAATANAVAQITIPSSTRILGIQYAIELDATADNSRAILEVSQASATEIAVNGAQQCIAELRMFQNFTTSGMTLAVQNGFLPVDVPVTQGQIIYLHAVVAGATFYFNGLIWLRN